MENQKCNHRSNVTSNNNDFILHKIDTEKVADAFVPKAAENIAAKLIANRVSQPNIRQELHDLVQAYNNFIQYLEYGLIQLDRDDTNFKIQELREAIEKILEHQDPTGEAYKKRLPFLERL